MKFKTIELFFIIISILNIILGIITSNIHSILGWTCAIIWCIISILIEKEIDFVKSQTTEVKK